MMASLLAWYLATVPLAFFVIAFSVGRALPGDHARPLNGLRNLVSAALWPFIVFAAALDVLFALAAVCGERYARR
jgi:multisubunit Na+/H+ antiporter MnhB subunit